jgi:hypothetical protein
MEQVIILKNLPFPLFGKEGAQMKIDPLDYAKSLYE